MNEQAIKEKPNTLKNKILSKGILIIGVLLVIVKTVLDRNDEFSIVDMILNPILLLTFYIASKAVDKSVVVKKEDLLDSNKEPILDEKETKTIALVEKFSKPSKIITIASALIFSVYLIITVLYPDDTNKQFDNLDSLLNLFFIVSGIGIGIPILAMIYLWLRKKNKN